MSKSVELRKADLAAAKKQFARSKKQIGLDELATLYGLTKAAFVNLRNTIEGFPDPARVDGNKYFYPAYRAITALLDYVERRERTTMERSRRFHALVQAPDPEADPHHLPMSAQEQLKAFDLRQKLIDEAVKQGQLHRAADCQQVTEKVFTLISQTFSQPTTTMDPTGKWPAAVRKAVDAAGEALVLRCYGELKDMLGGHADQPVSRPSPSRAGRSRLKPKRKAGKGQRRLARKS